MRSGIVGPGKRLWVRWDLQEPQPWGGTWTLYHLRKWSTVDRALCGEFLGSDLQQANYFNLMAKNVCPGCLPETVQWWPAPITEALAQGELF